MADLGRILGHVNPDELVELTRRLVRIDSTEPEQAAVEFIAAALAGWGVPHRTAAPGRPNLLAVPADGEGLMLGIRTMLAAGWCDGADGAIVAAATANQPCIAQKGALRAVVRAYGQMAHGAVPGAGVNPIPPLAEMVQRLALLQAEERSRRGRDPLLGWPSITPTALACPRGRRRGSGHAPPGR